MAQGGHSNRDRGGKLHPLFVELYMSDDSADSDEAEERRASRARARRRIPQKLVNRRA
jgi:hypothetical protein